MFYVNSLLQVIYFSSYKTIVYFCVTFSSEFLSPGAKSEINIDGRTLEATKVAMKTASRFTFEVAATHIYKLLLKNDCYPRFIRSENYKTILANAVNPTKRNTR